MNYHTYFSMNYIYHDTTIGSIRVYLFRTSMYGYRAKGISDVLIHSNSRMKQEDNESK